MDTRDSPVLIPTEELPAFFRSNGIAYQSEEPLSLAFGQGNDQYRLFSYPGPADDETMGLFCEWHTGDFFDADSGPHLGIGMRGPVQAHPHRGRGLAIGILASQMTDPDKPGHVVPLFRGCPDWPGGPSFFLEDFSVNDGVTGIEEWQLSLGKPLPQLHGNGIYRIDVHVSQNTVWAGIWQVREMQSAGGRSSRDYSFIGQAIWPDEGPGPGKHFKSPHSEDINDRGCGNVFIGAGFADPETNARVDNIHIAHWKNTTPLS